MNGNVEHPAGRTSNNSNLDGTLIHPEEPDTGIVAGIVIAIATAVLFILSGVSENLYKLLCNPMCRNIGNQPNFNLQHKYHRNGVGN